MQGTAAETREASVAERRPTDEAGRRRAAVELIARDGFRLKSTARRYSLCAEDAEDAYQRGLEILLTKAPTENPRELLAWTTTVVKHEALAVRGARVKLLGQAPAGGGEERDGDWTARLASAAPDPLERLERREDVARSREAIRALKPAERRALALLAEGYSYAEIGEITGFSRTKVNRCLAEGRERFRQIVASSEDGRRCAELRPLLSAFCDGETGPRETDLLREHLRACGPCRATMRAYRAAPATIAALCPLPAVLSATAGAKGGGVLGGAKGALASLGKAAGVQKALAVCAVGGAAVGVATGVVPLPKASSERPVAPRVQQVDAPIRQWIGDRPSARSHLERARSQPSAKRAGSPAQAPPPAPAAAPEPAVEPKPYSAAASSEPVEAPPEAEPAPAPAPPPPTPAPAPPPPTVPDSGGAAGEFGP